MFNLINSRKEDSDIQVGIDYGTSGIAVMLRYKDDTGEHKEHLFRAWEGDETKLFKTRSDSLYEDDNETIKYSCNKALIDLLSSYDEDEDDDEEDEEEEFFYRRPKLGLCDLKNESLMISDVRGKRKKKANDVICEQLKQVLKEISVQVKTNLKKDWIELNRWICCTIPTLYEDKQKQLMKNILLESGITKTESQGGKVKLTLSYEPESAAFYCFKRYNLDLSEGSTYLIVDGGAGTVDLTTYIVRKKRIRETSRGQGEACGGSFINEKMIGMISDWIGKERFEKYKEEKEYFQFLSDIEQFKLNIFKREKSDYEVKPILEKIIDDSIEGNRELMRRYYQGSLSFLPDDISYIFDGTTEKIKSLIKKQVQLVSKVNPAKTNFDKIMFAGGLAKCKIIVEGLKTEFNNIKILKDPETAVIRGTMYYYTNISHPGESVLSHRVMKNTYYVEVNEIYNEKIHKISKDKIKTKGNERVVTGVLDKLITMNDQVELAKCISRNYRVAHENQSVLTLSLYYSLLAGEQKVYSDDNRVKKLGTLEIDISDSMGLKDRTFEVQLYPGETELVVKAVHKKTNKYCHAEIKYEGVQEVRNNFIVHGGGLGVKKYHLIFLNDKSGSMNSCDVQPHPNYEDFLFEDTYSDFDNRLGALYEAMHNLLTKYYGTESIASCVMYDHIAKVAFEKEAINENLIRDHLNSYDPNGGTSYTAAFVEAIKLVQGTDKSYKNIILFMTDGYSDEDCRDKVKQLVNIKGKSVEVYCFSIGNEAKQNVLDEISKIGNGRAQPLAKDIKSLISSYLTLPFVHNDDPHPEADGEGDGIPPEEGV